jgi:hypothetical protein
LTVPKPLARYRVHGGGYGGMTSVSASKLRAFLHQDAEKAHFFAAVSRQLDLPVPRDPLKANLNHLQYRLASYLLEPSAHPFPKDTKSSLVYRLMSSAAKSSQMPLRDRGILLTWASVCALAPRQFRRHLILWRFSATSRPALVRTLLDTLSSLRSPRLPDRA